MESKRKYIKSEDFDKIIMRNAYGSTADQIAKELDCSDDTVKRVLRAHQIVKSQDWEEAKRFISNGYRMKHLKYFAEKMGIDIPEDVYVTYDLWKVSNGEVKIKAVEQEQKDDAPVQEVLDDFSKAQNDNLYFCKMLEALAKQNELLEQFMDVVIPKYAGDLKDSMNVNSDLVTQRLKNCEEKLEKITYNTRKRGM